MRFRRHCIRLVSNIKCLMMMGLVDMAWPAKARRGTSWKTFKSEELDFRGLHSHSLDLRTLMSFHISKPTHGCPLWRSLFFFVSSTCLMVHPLVISALKNVTLLRASSIILMADTSVTRVAVWYSMTYLSHQNLMHGRMHPTYLSFWLLAFLRQQCLTED